MSVRHHEGELWLRAQVGELQQGSRNAQVVQGEIMERALDFIARQHFVALGSRAADDSIWASILIGDEFMSADARSVTIDLQRSVSTPMDPLWDNLAPGNPVGMLIIEFGKRRRLRINGRVTGLTSSSLIIGVEEAYPNCPKYIQRRHYRGFETAGAAEPDGRFAQQLSESQRQLIQSADTFFVASAHPEYGVDVSHRGGNPGFVLIDDDTRLCIPDYAGNSMYNTLGNIHVNPKSGLLFYDFERGRVLQMTGEAEILLNREDPEGRTGGTNRWWSFAVRRVFESGLAPVSDWELLDYSPVNPEPPSGQNRRFARTTSSGPAHSN